MKEIFLGFMIISLGAYLAIIFSLESNTKNNEINTTQLVKVNENDHSSFTFVHDTFTGLPKKVSK